MLGDPRTLKAEREEGYEFEANLGYREDPNYLTLYSEILSQKQMNTFSQAQQMW